MRRIAAQRALAGRTRLLLRPLLAVALLALLATAPLSLHGGASAAGSGPEMRLTISDGGFCNGNTCYAGAGASFTLAVEAVAAPAVGYVAFLSYLDFGTFHPDWSEDGYGPGTCSDGWDNGWDSSWDRYEEDCATADLVYKPDEMATEITWPDLNPSANVREESGPGLVAHGALTGFTPPLPVSSYEGRLLALEMACPATPLTTSIALLPFGDPVASTSGAAFVQVDGLTIIPHTAKGNTLTVNCVAKQASPGDTDGDGCRDVRENNSNPALGGLRDYLDPWDFYDVASFGGVPQTDGVIDQPNDVMGVIAHYAPQGQPPYDVHYDRGPVVPARAQWPTGPDGVIDLPNDILGVIAQQGHTCQ